MELSRRLRRLGGMTTQPKTPGVRDFIAFEISLQIIESLRETVARIRQHDAHVAQQIVRSASSISANLAEGNRRQGRDRLHLFRIAAGSADETRAHLRVALAWGWLSTPEVEPAFELIDRELAIL